MSDVMFDNVFSDLAMHGTLSSIKKDVCHADSTADKIKKAAQDVQKARTLVKSSYMRQRTIPLM
jgi:hypothetical protein